MGRHSRSANFALTGRFSAPAPIGVLAGGFSLRRDRTRRHGQVAAVCLLSKRAIVIVIATHPCAPPLLLDPAARGTHAGCTRDERRIETSREMMESAGTHPPRRHPAKAAGRPRNSGYRHQPVSLGGYRQARCCLAGFMDRDKCARNGLSALPVVFHDPTQVLLALVTDTAGLRPVPEAAGCKADASLSSYFRRLDSPSIANEGETHDSGADKIQPGLE